jgi:hypothetical protein
MSGEKDCLGCGQKFKRSDTAVLCTVCGLWAHKKCLGISDEFFKFLAEQYKATGKGYWACRACSNYAEGMNHRLREIQQTAEEALKIAQESRKETEQLRKETEKEREKVEKRVEKCELNVLEEMGLREEKRKNVVIYGMEEAAGNDGWKRMEEDRAKLNELFTVLDINVAVETDVEFCRRVGEKGERARPLVVGFFTEWAKSVLLKNCKHLAGSELSHLSVANDLTETQRKMERELVAEAERRNAERTEEEKSKNIEWRVVGKKGLRRLIKTPGQGQATRAAPARGAWRGAARGAEARGGGRGAGPSILPPQRGRGAWRPVTGDTAERSDSRKRQRSAEGDQQRKRGAGNRGRPPLRARPAATAARVGRSSPEMVQETEDSMEEEEEEIPVSQLIMSSSGTGSNSQEADTAEEEMTGATAGAVEGARGTEGEDEETMVFPTSGIMFGTI